MNCKYYFLFLLLLISPKADGQEFVDSLMLNKELVGNLDSLAEVYPSLPEIYYHNSRFLRHNYEYDITDKRRKLEMKRKNLISVGILAFLVSTILMEEIGETHDWSYAVSIPSAFALSAATSAPFFIWSEKIRKKKARMEEQSAMIFKINKRSQVGIVRFPEGNDFGYGFCIKTLF